jgi:hypothetical protein
MNDQEHDGQLDALFAQARAHRPDTSKAEYAFETRLLARLRTERETSSVWAMVSWRLIPFFAACVVALTLWQAEVASDTTDAATIAGLTNPVAADLWSN